MLWSFELSRPNPVGYWEGVNCNLRPAFCLPGYYRKDGLVLRDHSVAIAQPGLQDVAAWCSLLWYPPSAFSHFRCNHPDHAGRWNIHGVSFLSHQLSLWPFQEELQLGSKERLVEIVDNGDLMKERCLAASLLETILAIGKNNEHWLKSHL